MNPKVLVLLVILLSISLSSFSDEAVYLSDIPEQIIFITQGWGETGWDVSAHAPGQSGLILQIGEKEYEKGIGHHSPGEIVLDLNKKYKCFKCEVGVQKQNRSNVGSVIFQIEVDGEKRWDSGVRRELDPPLPVEIDLREASELRLIVKDAGDGIAYDCANWADAKLILAEDVINDNLINNLDIAPFGEVVSCDPTRYEGARCSRTEEFPSEDIYLETKLIPQEDGLYQLPDFKGIKCIGLRWYERRKLTAVEIEFCDYIPERVWVEVWTGESPWQGNWQRLKGSMYIEGTKCLFRISWRENTFIWKGTEKVRWICESGNPLFVKALHAYTNSSWKNTSIRLESETKCVQREAVIKVYNGRFLDTFDAYSQKWIVSEPIILNLQYSVPRKDKGDRTLLWVSLPEKNFCIAIEDVLNYPCVYIPEVGIFAVVQNSPLTLEEYKEAIRGKSSVLDLVRGFPEQTFSKAMEKVHRPIQDNGPTMISLACDNNKFIIERDGSILFNDFYAEVKMGSSERLRRSLLNGWLPVPVVEKEEDGVKYTSKTFVSPYGNKKSLCVSQFEIINTDGKENNPEFSITFYSDKKEGKKAELKNKEGFIVIKGNKTFALCATNGASIEICEENVLKVASIPSAYPIKVILIIPCDEEIPLNDLEKVRVDELLENTIEYWKGVIASSTKIEVPEPLLNNLIKASQVHCLISARSECNGNLVVPWIASMAYGPLESEAHSIIYGMDLMGWHEFSRRSLEFFIHKYNDAGYLTTGYTLVGTGWHLWTLAEHYRLTGDKEWLIKHADKISKVCDWIIDQCAKTKKLSSDGEQPPEYGLFPPAVGADWNRYAYRFFVQGHFYAGLYGASSILKEIDYPSADRYIKEADELRTFILRAFEWNRSRSPVLPLSNGKWILPYPSILYAFGTAGEMFPGEDSGRSWAYDVELGAHHLIPLGVLDPYSSDAENIIQHMEDYWFLHSDYWYAFSGEGDYPEEKNKEDWFNLGGFSKIQPYYTRIAEVYAMRDDVKPFIRAYFNAIPSLLNTENLSFWEHFHNIGAWNKTHETGWFLVQTRKMFVREDKDSLWLAPFVPSHWLEPGNKIKLENADTYFGNVSFDMESKVGEKRIDIAVHINKRVKFNKIMLRVRAPSEKSLEKVLVNGTKYDNWEPQLNLVYLFPSMNSSEDEWLINCFY